LRPLSAPILVVPYDSAWPDRFQRECQKIRTALGQQALRIEHVGSTSVPGLPAKPIIDILLVVADSANEVKYATALEGAGFRLHIREPGWHEHRLFKGPEEDINLHVFSAGCSEVERMLAFRDWLRKNEADRELYAECKRRLAQQQWKYTQNYADAKTPVIEEILSRASRRERNSDERGQTGNSIEASVTSGDLGTDAI
jgi:GrpB-like predicted nucleotidyltransferase (UPF0157 family)